MSNIFIQHYGTETQLKKLKEDAIELAYVIENYLDEKDTVYRLKEKKADCQNIIEQFEEHFNDASINIIKCQKQNEQREEMRNGK